jgi:hypothetical protein
MPKTEKNFARGIDKFDIPGYYTFYATLTNAVTRHVPAVRRVVAVPVRGFPRFRGRGAIATIAAVVTMRTNRSQPPRQLVSPRFADVPTQQTLPEPVALPVAPFELPPVVRATTLS